MDFFIEKRNNESKEALLFAQELTECGSHVEVLSFLNILLKRFEYCQQFKMPTEPKVRNVTYRTRLAKRSDHWSWWEFACLLVANYSLAELRQLSY